MEALDRMAVDSAGCRPRGRTAPSSSTEYSMQTNLMETLPATTWPEATRRSGERDASSVDAKTWGAVGSMAMCVALLIAAEFMPVSLLTPIAHDLGATV